MHVGVRSGKDKEKTNAQAERQKASKRNIDTHTLCAQAGECAEARESKLSKLPDATTTKERKNTEHNVAFRRFSCQKKAYKNVAASV